MLDKSDILGSEFHDYEIFPLEENMDVFCSGRHQKHLFIGTVGQSNSELEGFLEKIMQSVKYEVGNDALRFLLTSPTPFSFKNLDNNYHFKHALFFGIKPKDAGINLAIVPYQPLRHGSIEYLFCHDLQRIQSEPALKKQLWDALKSMFLK